MSKRNVSDRTTVRMKELGTTPAAIARRAGLSATALRESLDDSTASDRPATLSKIARALGVSHLSRRGRLDDVASDPAARLAAARADVPPSLLTLARARGLTYDQVMILSLANLALTTYTQKAPTTPEGWLPFLDVINVFSRPAPAPRARRTKRPAPDTTTTREAAKAPPPPATQRTREATPAAGRPRTKRQ